MITRGTLYLTVLSTKIREKERCSGSYRQVGSLVKRKRKEKWVISRNAKRKREKDKEKHFC